MPYLPVQRTLIRIVKLFVLFLALSSSGALAQAADPMTGTFSDGFMTIQITGQNSQYSGQFEAGGRTYPFTASGNNQRIDGTYQDAGQFWQFTALLNGDTLTFQNAAQTFRLTRMGGGGQQTTPQPSGYLPAGTRITWSQAVQSTPAAVAGPDARITGGTGFLQLNIHSHDAANCVATMTMYSRGLTVNTLTVSSSDSTVSDGNSCFDYWRSPAVLAGYQAAPGGIETVERGPFQHGGRTYNAISISTNYQNNRSWRVYDLDSGILLSFTEASGDPNNTAAGYTSAVQEFVNVRQVALPWSTTVPLPSNIQNLSSLTYSGQVVQSTPGITMFDASSTYEMQVTYTMQQRGAAWMTAQSTMNLSMMGIPLSPVQQQVVITSGTGHFIPTSVIPQLQAGQVLDTDPVTGHRLSVERADQSGVVLVTEGPGYRFASTFDPGSGVMLSSRSESQEEGNLRTVTTELSGWQ